VGQRVGWYWVAHFWSLFALGVPVVEARHANDARIACPFFCLGFRGMWWGAQDARAPGEFGFQRFRRIRSDANRGFGPDACAGHFCSDGGSTRDDSGNATDDAEILCGSGTAEAQDRGAFRGRTQEV
jgi:hypothetical protein